ncbi:phage tail protein [Kitasatospora sp. NPDC048540]|uniref:phage tail protein n=1 Tax=unclassified Kitasatospora TaxID=2633591 RepID=UPI00053AB7F6|nr:phage tail protein [Kitasatospora sp. MBT63]
MTTFDSLGLANRFQVKLDGATNIDLGFWSTVGGLDVTWGLCEYRAGDSGNSRLYYPGSTKYSDIVLTRAACAQSQTVQDWLSQGSLSLQKWSGTIYLGNTETQAIMTWTLINVMPLKWAIEKFDASASKVAIETLTLAHEGFLKDDTKFNSALLAPGSVQASSTSAGFGDTSAGGGAARGTAGGAV